MRVVAVATLHQPFVHAMMKGPEELLLYFQMAAIAKSRLLLAHQELALFGVVRIVAIRAPYVVLQVRGTPKIAVFLPVGVASQAALTDFLGGSVLEGEDFRLIAAALDVFFARTMAGFAPMPFRAPLGVHGGDKVR